MDEAVHEDTQFGRLLVGYRLAANLTQAALAEQAEIGDTTIAALKMGASAAHAPRPSRVSSRPWVCPTLSAKS